MEIWRSKRNLGFYLEDLREIWMCLEEGTMEFQGLVGDAKKKLWGRAVSFGFTVEPKGDFGVLCKRPEGSHGIRLMRIKGFRGPGQRGGLSFVSPKVTEASSLYQLSNILCHEEVPKELSPRPLKTCFWMPKPSTSPASPALSTKCSCARAVGTQVS